MERFSSYFLKLRNFKGVSSADVAKYLGVTISYVYMIENGSRIPSLGTVHKIADFLNIDASQRELLLIKSGKYTMTPEQQFLKTFVDQDWDWLRKTISKDSLYQIYFNALHTGTEITFDMPLTMRSYLSFVLAKSREEKVLVYNDFKNRDVLTGWEDQYSSILEAMFAYDLHGYQESLYKALSYDVSQELALSLIYTLSEINTDILTVFNALYDKSMVKKIVIGVPNEGL